MMNAATTPYKRQHDAGERQRETAAHQVGGPKLLERDRAQEHLSPVLEMMAEARRLTDWIEAQAAEVVEAVALGCLALKGGKQIIFCGNGGSAAQAAHLAGELAGRFYRDRRGLRAIALTENTAALTAIANDYGYERVFERQLQALAARGDVLVALTTSGSSANIVRACEFAAELGMPVIGLTGQRGAGFAERCEVGFAVPSLDTARIQEVHILLGHLICARIEAELFPEPV